MFLYGPYVGGYGFGAVTDGTLLDDTLNDSVGQAIIARTLALVVLGLVLAQLFRSRSTAAAAEMPATPADSTVSRIGGTQTLVAGAAVLVGAALVSQVFAGHGNTGPHKTLGALFTIIHVGSTALWIGGLIFVVATIGAATTTDSGSGSTNRDSLEAEAVLRRFSPLAFAAVIGMVVSGGFASWRQVGSVQAARETTYGQLLLVKLALVVVILALGGLARRHLQRPPVATTVTPPSPQPTSSVNTTVNATVRRRLFLEAALGMVVVGVTALLVNVAPAREVVSKPVALRLATTTLNVDVTIDPARKGLNAIHIYALTKTGAQQPIDHASLSATHGSGIAPIELKVLRAGPNHFQVLNADLPLNGVWTLKVSVGVDQFTEEQASAQITLR